MIDDFEAGDFNVSDNTTTPTETLGEQTGLATTNVAGGTRLVAVGANGTLNLQALAALTTTPADDGVALTTLGILPGDTATFRFVYDGNAVPALQNDAFVGSLNLDLNDHSHFEIVTTGLTGASPRRSRCGATCGAIPRSRRWCRTARRSSR